MRGANNGRANPGGNAFNNQQDALFDGSQGALRTKTHLIQIYTDDIERAPQLVSEPHANGVPIMVIINNQCSCKCKVNIPNGMYTLEQKWGKDNGIMDPGYECCYLNYKRIAVMVSKNTIRYRCPIIHIPTKDNVRVTMDIGINFHIGQPHLMGSKENHDDIKKFFYNFGPNRLEELLSEQVDEEIRTFTKQIKVSKIRDIKSELCVAMKEQLHKQFQPYGVYIEQVNIMNVILPRDLREFLMFTTNYDVYLQKQVKQQQNKMLILNNNENKKILQLKRDNIQKLMTCQHDIDIEEIEQIQTQIEMETAQQMKTILANKKKNVAIINANNIRTLAEKRAQAKATVISNEASAYFNSQKIFADTQSNIINENAQARLKIAKSKSTALIKESSAEADQAENMEQLRRFKEKMRLAESMKETARVSKIVVAGEKGTEVLGYFNDAIDQISQR